MTTLVADLAKQWQLDEALVEQGLAQELAKSLSLFRFCREVLGYHEMLSAEQEVLPGFSHHALCDFLEHDPRPFKLILMPRYSFKSHTVTIGATLHSLVHDPNQRFLFYSDVNEKAEGFLQGVKDHILGTAKRSRFRAIFPRWELDPKEGTWNQSSIVIRARTYAHEVPTISTAGVETSKVGKHYDRLVFDDLVTDKNVTTRELIDKVKDVYRRGLSLLKPGGQIWMLGTPWDFADLYMDVQAREEENAKLGEPAVFAVFKRPASVEGVYPWAAIGLTRDFLRQQRKEQGSYFFSCLYDLSPQDEETQTFKAQQFTFYDPRHLPKGLFLTACLDPIPRHEANSQGDDAALTVCGTDQELNLYVVDIVAGRLQPDEQIEAIMEAHAAWGLSVVALEAIAFQRELRPMLERRIKEARRKNSRFRLFEIKEITSREATKINRIRGLQPYHERGALRLPGTRVELLEGAWAKLASQMLRFPKNAQTKDDVLDSLADHLQIHRAGVPMTPPPPQYPFSSAAWFEREQRNEELRELARRPRWRRRPLPELAFS